MKTSFPSISAPAGSARWLIPLFLAASCSSNPTVPASNPDNLYTYRDILKFGAILVDEQKETVHSRIYCPHSSNIVYKDVPCRLTYEYSICAYCIPPSLYVQFVSDVDSTYLSIHSQD